MTKQNESSNGTNKTDFKDRVREALEVHGFPLEIEVHQLLENRGWKSQAESAFEDPDENKVRRVDFIAWKCVDVKSRFYDDVAVTLVIECKRRANSAWVFYRTTREPVDPDDAVDLLAQPGFVLMAADDDWLENYSESGIKKVLSKSHQLPFNHPMLAISGHDIAVETEQERKKRIEETKKGRKSKRKRNEGADFLHRGCVAVTKALEWHFQDQVTYWKEIEETAPRRFGVFYPVVILDGKMFEAKIVSGILELVPVNYLQLLWETREDLHIIDIMTQQYFKEYLRAVEKELLDLKGGVESLVTSTDQLKERILRLVRRKKPS